jgi:hypothetical protein
VAFGTEWLLCFLGQYRLHEGFGWDKEALDRLATSGAEMLSSLLRAWTARCRGDDTAAIVSTVSRLCTHTAPEKLEALRGRRDLAWLGDDDLDYIIDGLLALQAETQRRRKALQQPEQAPVAGTAVPEPEPAPAEPERGWEF